jgi:GxxExxY protein
MPELIYKEEAYTVIGLCMEVHRILGPGFLEAVYKDALEYELKKALIPYTREQAFLVPYKDTILRKQYCADFTLYDKIILEAKALDSVPDEVIGRAINYLKVSKYRLCLLINFGKTKLEYQRIVL